MCQLTMYYADPALIEFGKMFLPYALIKNSAILNLDGWGIYAEDLCFKSGEKPISQNDLKVCTDKVLEKNKPVIGHVRAASSTTPRLLGTTHNHPFFIHKGRFILAHNGTLTYKNPENEKRIVEECIDSKKFLIELESYADKNPGKTTVEAIAATVDLFYGKFAFLIYDIRTGIQYVVRGETAKLHFAQILDAEGVARGIVVNTEKDDLEAALSFARIFAKLSVKFTTPAEIKQNTIFVLDKATYTLTEVGTVLETKKPLPPATTYVQQTWSRGGTDGDESVVYVHNPPSTVATGIRITVNVLDAQQKRLAELAKKLLLSPADVDNIAVVVFGKGLLCLFHHEVTNLIKVLEGLQKLTTPEKEAGWLSTCESYDAEMAGSPDDDLLYVDPYILYGLKFPWMMNENFSVLTPLKDNK